MFSSFPEMLLKLSTIRQGPTERGGRRVNHPLGQFSKSANSPKSSSVGKLRNWEIAATNLPPNIILKQRWKIFLSIITVLGKCLRCSRHFCNAHPPPIQRRLGRPLTLYSSQSSAHSQPNFIDDNKLLHIKYLALYSVVD